MCIFVAAGYQPAEPSQPIPREETARTLRTNVRTFLQKKVNHTIYSIDTGTFATLRKYCKQNEVRNRGYQS
jgi:hypothetical protein